MFDYWVSNEVYFDADDVVPSVVMPNCYYIKSKNVAHIHGTDIHFSECPAFTVDKQDNIYLIKKYYHGKVQDIRELYLGKYKN